MALTAAARRKTTTERGLGWEHQQTVARLIRRLIEGTACWWCGLPMSKDKHRNWDCRALAGDHSTPRVHGGRLADRLLHGTCNSQRQDGRWDQHRPAATGVHPRDWHPPQGSAQTTTPTVGLAMDW